MAKVQNEMATRITIDTIQAANSMQALRQAVSANTNSWKAMEASLKSAGDYQGAAAERVKGLTQSIELQKQRISELRERQQGLDQSTQQGAQQFVKLENQISQANRQMASYEAQLSRAKSNSEYYAGGLANLQHQYKLNASASKAYVDRMAAEHRTASETVARYHQLASGLENLQEQYKIQSRMLEEIKNRSGETSDAYLKQKQRLDQTATSIAKTKDELKRLRVEEASLEPTGIARVDSAIIKMRDHTEQIQPKLKRLKDQVNSFWDSVKSGVMASGIAVSAFTAYTVDGAKKAEDIQHKYVTNTNLMTTAGEKQKDVQRAINQMYADGSTMSVKYGVSQQQIAEGYQTLIKRGYDSQMALGAMPKLLQAAKASGDDFNDAMEVTTSTLEAFGMKSDNANKMMQATSYTANTLAKAADVTSTDFSKLGIGMQYAGGTAKGAGISMRDTASALGELSNNGLEASQAGTSLQRIIVRLSSGSVSATNAFKQYGLSIDDFKTKSGKLKSIPEIFDQINKKVPKADRLKVFNQAFGQSAQSAAVILSSNLKDLDAVEGKVKTAYNEDYIGKLARRNMESAKSAQDRFKYASQAIQIEVGQALLPAISKASVALAEAFSKKSTKQAFADLAKDLGKIAMAVVKFAVYCSKHKTMVVGFAKAIAVAFVFTKAMSGLNALIKGIGLFARVIKVATLGFNPWMIAIEVALVLIIKYHKQIGKFANGIASAVKKGFGKALSAVEGFFKGAGKFFTGQLGWEKAIGKEISKIVSTIGKTFSKIGSTLKKIGKAAIMAFVYALALPVGIGIMIMRPLIKGITSAFSKLWLQVKKVWQASWNGLVKVASAIWKPISKPIQAGLKLIQSLINAGLKYISRTWQEEVNFWGNIISTVWNTIKKVVTAGMKAIQTVISPVLKAISHVWNDTWNSISNFFGNIWDGMSRTGKKTFGGIRDWFSDILDSISKKWSDVWNGLSSVFSKVWDGIKSVAKTGWNAIIGFINTGVEGINSVIHFFGGKESTVPKLKKLARGTSANERDEFALVNDEAGAIYREAIVRSSGKVEIPKKRNQLVYLNRGDEVISARKTAEIFNLNRYANGKKGWLSAAWDNVKDWAGDTFKAIEDALKDPLGVLMGLFHKGKNTATAVWHDMGEGAANYLPKVGAEWFKKQLEKLQDALTPDNPSGSNVQRWKPYIEKAFKELHATATETKINKLLRQINTESRGNPLAWQQVHDVNSGGNEARGLLQFAGSTWRADALPGHTDWRNGYDEILAAIHVLEHGGEGGWGNVGNGHGWAMGGLISQHGRYEIAENNLPEYVIPTDISKRSRANQLLGEVITQFSSESKAMGNPLTGSPLVSSENEIKTLNSKFDRLLSLVTELIGVNNDQVQAIQDQGSLDMQQVYRKQARDMRMRQTGLGGA